MRSPAVSTPGRRRDFLFFSAAAVFTAVFVFAVDPSTGGIYPPCPTHLLTGLHCPGCGSLRALHALLHGHPAAAVRSNLLLIMLMPYFAWEYVSFGLSAFAGRTLPRLFASKAGAWCLAGVIAAFTILRNTPLYPFTLLAP